jgi:hypothetical protein
VSSEENFSGTGSKYDTHTLSSYSRTGSRKIPGEISEEIPSEYSEDFESEAGGTGSRFGSSRRQPGSRNSGEISEDIDATGSYSEDFESESGMDKVSMARRSGMYGSSIQESIGEVSEDIS